MTHDFDLDLPSLWYTKLPPIFPVPSMRAHGPHTSTYAYEWIEDFTGTKKVLTCAVRFTADMSTTKVRITWRASDPSNTVTAVQKHFPPPSDLSPEELDKAHKAYGQNVADWCEASIGQTVGDGECWTMIYQALQELATAYVQHGKEPPLISQGRSHGFPLLALSASSPGTSTGLLQLADVCRGDVLQMKNAHFQTIEAAPIITEQVYGKWQKGRGEKNVRLAHHTAVVIRVEGDKLRVVEQNGSVPGCVSEGVYDLGEMVSGEAAFFRVVGERWCGSLDASWE